MTNILREMIKSPFEIHYRQSIYELEDYVKKCVSVYNLLKKLKVNNEDAFFNLVKLVFRKKLNITKKLKIEKFHKINTEGYIIYNGKFKSPYAERKSDGAWEEGERWEDVKIEMEIDDYKITVNIVFMETGEIRQAQLRFDI